MPATTLLNLRGDVTLAWDEPDDPQILAMIEAKMKEGYAFFLIEPRLGGMAAPAKVPLREPHDALRQRTISMTLAGQDIAIAGLIENGTVTPTKTPDKPMRGARRTKSAKEAAAGETVAVRPARGG